MTKEETALAADFVGGKSVADDDEYIEFYENNPNMIHFDPPLTINEFKALLEESLKQDGKAGKRIGKMSGVGQE